MLKDILIPFLLVGIAELGDKTQLAVMCLSSQTKKVYQLLFGVILAFIIADGLAILLGDVISKVIPINYLKIASGVIFITFGIITLLGGKEEEKGCSLKSPFLSGFGVILISEMGDKTQISSALLAVEFNPIGVFIGVILAMALLSVAAIYLGSYIANKISKKQLSIAAATLFIIIGLWSFISAII